MAKTIYNATGRRKQSVAKVNLTKGKGKITINKMPVDEYFTQKTSVMDLIQPLEFVEMLTEYDVDATCSGGGHSGQAGAVRLGIARALLKANAEFRPILKAKGMLTRDSRVKERKKYGLKKARRAPQFSKR